MFAISSAESPISKDGEGKGEEVGRKEAVLSPDCHLDPQNWDKSQPVAVLLSFCNALAHGAQLEDGKID